MKKGPNKLAGPAILAFIISAAFSATTCWAEEKIQQNPTPDSPPPSQHVDVPIVRQDVEPTAQNKEAEPNKWAAVASVLGVSAQTHYDISVAGTSTSASDHANGALQPAGEIEYEVAPHFSMAGEIAYTPYNYAGTGDTDKNLSFSGLPRLRFHDTRKGWFGDHGVYWLGIGVGYARTTIGGNLSGSSAGYTLTIPNRNISGFVWSPRVGADMEFDTWLIRSQFEYNMASASTPYTLVNSQTLAQVTSGTISIQRNWWAIGVGVGARF